MNEGLFREAEQRLWKWAGASPTEHRLQLERNGVTVRVQELGAGPPVVFVHGANTSGCSWAALSARLPGFRCLILDRPGTGLSAALPGALDAESVPAFG